MQIPSPRVGTSPADSWRDAKSESAPILPATAVELKIAFGIPYKRVLQRPGIWLHGLRYTGERLQDLSRSQLPGSRLVLSVVVDPEDIGCIRVLDPENNEYFEVPALNQGYAAGLSLRQHKTILRRAPIYSVPELISIDRGVEFTCHPADNTKLDFTRGRGTTVERATPVDLSEEEHQLINLRRKYVVAVADLPAVKTVMEKAILKVWEEERMPDSPPSWIDVFRWRTRYFALAEEDIALLDRVGGKRNWKAYGDVVVKICAQAIDQVYMCRWRGTIQDVLDCARQKVQEEQKRLNEERAPSSGAIILKLPTRGLITKMLAKIPEFDRYAARYGTIAATMRFRWVRKASPKRAEGSDTRKAS